MSFNEIITYPFAWLLRTLYELTANYGLAIILFAVVVKLIMLPFQMKSKRSMMRTSRLTPIMKELEKKHEGNKQKYQEEVSRLYKEEKINPLSGCLWTLIPFPILIALYSVIRQPLTRLMRLTAEQVSLITDRLAEMNISVDTTGAYSEISLANHVHEHFPLFEDISDKLINIDFSFLGVNLGQKPQWNFFMDTNWSDVSVWLPALGLFLIPVVSALVSYFSMKVSNASNQAANDQNAQSMKSMMLMMPLVSLYIGFIMPAALGVYWIANSGLAIIQDFVLNRHYTKILDAEDAERRERLRLRETELEKKRLETERNRELGATERNRNTSKKKLQTAEKAQNDERLAAVRAEEKARRRAELGLSDAPAASQVGTRRYARGRAYVPDRFTDPEKAEQATQDAAALSEIDEQVESEFPAKGNTETQRE